MTNKPMLSVERDIIELAHTVFVRAGYESVARDLKILLCKKEDKQPAPVAMAMPDVDELAQIIRKVDGSHTLGADSMAEAILEEVSRLNGVSA